MSIEKLAILIQKKRKETGEKEWALVSKKDRSKVLKWFGKRKPSKEHVLEEEKRIQFFKHKKAELVEKMASLSDELDENGDLYLSDIITNCIKLVTNGELKQIPLKLKKVGDLLDEKGYLIIAERVDDLIPEVLELKESDGNITKKESSGRFPADKIYKLALSLRHKYMSGLIDEKCIEYTKMQDFENMLKTGFLLPPPSGMKQLPKNTKNWWEYFTNKKEG